MSRNNILHCHLLNNPDEAPASRLRGTSTGLALRFVSQAILNPDTDVVVKDHHGTALTDKLLLGSVEWVIRSLRLLGFKTGRKPTGEYYCRFNLTVPT